MEKTIYNLKLHQTIYLDTNGNSSVFRVSGGWIYYFQFPGMNQVNSVFIPFNNEFMEDEPK